MYYNFLTSLILFASFFTSILQADNRTQNNLLPNVKFELSPREISENSGVAFLGEAGRRNYRINTTFGYLISNSDRCKISVEYLRQKLGYKFITGTERKWVHQGAFGVAYQHDFCNPYIVASELSAYYSYAPSKSFHTEVTPESIYSRRIAGGTAYGGSISATVLPWENASLQIIGDYDYVNYRRKFKSHKHISGFGGGFDFYQQIFCQFGINIAAEFRRPFNYYRAGISWISPSWSNLSVGIYASHTSGKYSLPNSTIAGVEIGYQFGQGSPYYDDSCYASARDWVPFCPSPVLCGWINKPAVYMPEVLAIAEERLILIPCQPPTSTPIPTINILTPGPYSINVAPFFFGIGGTFVFSATGLPPGAAIDPETGVISGIYNSGVIESFSVTVTGSLQCGSTSQTFDINFCPGAPISVTIPDFSSCTSGAYAYDVSIFFAGEPGAGPLAFSAAGLPIGSTIDPVTGVISGLNLLDNITYPVTVTATNLCGSSSQPFTISFQCVPPTSIPIPNITISTNVGAVEIFNPTTGRFTSPCGQPITFSATNLPPGFSINPATGVITGLVEAASGGDFTVTITATTICGQTSQSFLLSIQLDD